MLIGFARVSTGEQLLDPQRDGLAAAGCDRVFEDAIFGSIEHRPGREEGLSFLRAGDALVVWRLDRLGRSLRHLKRVADKLQRRADLGGADLLPRPPRTRPPSPGRRRPGGRGRPAVRRPPHDTAALADAAGRGRARAEQPLLLGRVRAAPDATLAEHCAAWEAATGVLVSEATMCRALQKPGWPLKKRV